LGLCVISRSGWTDTYSQSGLWLGDQSSDASRFAGLESVLWGYKTAHDAGYRFIGMDAGGYFGCQV
jgi:alpha-glucosidase (family GH31 glycosyl hydrolase)